MYNQKHVQVEKGLLRNQPSTARRVALEHLSDAYEIFTEFCDNHQRWHAGRLAKLAWEHYHAHYKHLEGPSHPIIHSWIYNAMGYGFPHIVRWLLQWQKKPLELGTAFPESAPGAVAIACQRGDLATVE